MILLRVLAWPGCHFRADKIWKLGAEGWSGWFRRHQLHRLLQRLPSGGGAPVQPEHCRVWLRVVHSPGFVNRAQRYGFHYKWQWQRSVGWRKLCWALSRRLVVHKMPCIKPQWFQLQQCLTAGGESCTRNHLAQRRKCSWSIWLLLMAPSIDANKKKTVRHYSLKSVQI